MCSAECTPRTIYRSFFKTALSRRKKKAPEGASCSRLIKN
ncbi:hypothetical protein HMPREF9439_02566 [Parasutterella excrementihominis YIT 11859]|uniref:Uncharacterized protein n=1 Tax=Parasutterella excrementihominis YIT 11859 TaxID=762966 RepID=F3QNN0_9BURK|nr:hypothetical protein HMPREF9439_02566 [Parasutterella excrementihominis YIT 11859]